MPYSMHSLFSHGQLPLFLGHSKMKLTLQLIVLWLLLTKGKASEKRSHRKTVFSRTPSQGWVSNRTQQTLSDKPKAPEKSDTLTLASVGTSHSAGHHGSVQWDQGQRSGLNRRMMQNRRGQQTRTTANQGSVSQDPVVAKPERRRTLSPPSRTATGSVGSLNILASFAGKNRILVISSPHESDGYYRLMMSLLKSDVYCEMAERHMQQIILFHQGNEAGGKVRRVSNQGQVTEEPLDPVVVPKLMSFLKLEEGKFSMVLVRKNLQVEERYPYPVRLEAVYEVMDQTPIRKLEKARQRGFVQRCKAAGVEGQVVTTSGDGQQNATTGKTPAKETATVRPAKEPIRIPVVPTVPATTTTTRTTTKSTTTTTRRPARTTTKATTTTRRTPPTTTTKPPTTTTTTRSTTTTMPSTTAILTTPVPAKLQTDPWDTDPLSTNEDNVLHATDREGDGDHRITDPSGGKPAREVTPGQTEVTDGSLDEGAEESGGNHGRGGKKEVDGDVELISTTSKKGRKPDGQQRRKHPNKPNRKNKADKKRAKPNKEGSPNLRGRKSGKKGVLYQEKKHDGDGAAAKQPKPASPLASFFGSFERRRRLLVITTPSEENRMYTQQRDEYLENVCEMAVRKLSIITIFGSWDNGTMKIDHYQLEQDQALKGVPREDLTNQVLIKALREELGMTFNDYYMVLTDFDMKAKQEYEVPIAMKAVLDYIDTFSSRITEMEQQKKQGVTCKKEDKSRSLENFLSRFRWRRRLFIISAPDDEEWAYQQQLYSLTSQACNLGLRHMSVLKLVGKDMDFMGGVLELYPINGSSTVEREDLSATLVRDIRNYFQISAEYFSMLLVGKDGNVKSWYPSPMWSMSIIYDLVDSMQLRRQEMAIQQSLGMRCPDDEYSQHGYHEQDPDGYGHRGYGY